MNESKDISGKVIDFFQKIIGGPLEQIGGMAEDWIRYYRYKNLHSIADKVHKLRQERSNMGKTTIEPRIAIPMLEAAAPIITGNTLRRSPLDPVLVTVVFHTVVIAPDSLWAFKSMASNVK